MVEDSSVTNELAKNKQLEEIIITAAMGAPIVGGEVRARGANGVIVATLAINRSSEKP